MPLPSLGDSILPSETAYTPPIPPEVSFSSHEHHDIVQASQRLVSYMREHCGSHAEIEKLLRRERDRAIADCESLTNALDELWTEHSRCADLSTRVRDAEDKQREYQEIITRLRSLLRPFFL